MISRRQRIGVASVLAWILLVLTLPQDVVTAGDNVWDALHDPVFSRALLGFAGLAIILLILGPHGLFRGRGAGAPETPSSGVRYEVESAVASSDLVATPEPEPTPRLIFREPHTVEATVVRPPKLKTRGKFLIVPVSNDPGADQPGIAAEHVRAYVTILDASGREIVPERLARWQDKPQAPDLSPFQPTGSPELSEVTLYPNGADHGIDTVVYVREDREFHVWTQQGLAGEIKWDVFFVKVRVRGSNASASTTVMVTKTPQNPFDGFEVAPAAIPGSSAAASDATHAQQSQTPYARAHKLQSDYEARRLRAAMRTVAEDELANLVKPRLERLVEGEAMTMALATAQWTEHHELIRERADQQAYAAAAKAYRLVVDLHRDLGLERRQERITEADEAQAREALVAVDKALALLRAHTP